MKECKEITTRIRDLIDLEGFCCFKSLLIRILYKINSGISLIYKVSVMFKPSCPHVRSKPPGNIKTCLEF